MISKSEPREFCLDCGVNTFEIDEYYSLFPEVWAATGLEPSDGMLCIGCVETRLGRQLEPTDFTAAPVNWIILVPQSERLRSRLYP